MLYSCTKPAAHGGRLVARGRERSRTVDIHCHLHVAAAEALVKDVLVPENEPMAKFANEATRSVNRRQMRSIRAKLMDVPTRLRDMDAAGIDVQAISPAPFHYYYWAEPGLGRETSRVVNDRIAEVVAMHPERFVGLGTVPLQAPELAVKELERMVKKLGLRGVEIATNVAGEELSHPRFRKFFAKAEELDILVFMHPTGTTQGERLSDHYLINVIGNPLDSTIAVSHLIFGGVLEAHPRLKLCVAHGGGFLPAYSGRMDHAHGARSDCRRVIKRKPTHYLKRLYFDTIVFTPHQLEYLIRQYGAGHILMGTDYPYDMAEADPVGLLSRVPSLDAKARARVLGGNAARLLKLGTPRRSR